MEIKIQYGSRVVFKLSNTTGEVYRIDGGGVWVFDSRGEKWYWPWSMITVRFSRKILRHPFPRRWPRRTRNIMCHCRIGRMEARQNVETKEWEVWCLRCNQPIGAETFPARIRRASELYCKAHKRARVAERKVQAGVHGGPDPRSGNTNQIKTPRKDTNKVALSSKKKTNTIPIPKVTITRCLKRRYCQFGARHRCQTKLLNGHDHPMVCEIKCECKGKSNAVQRKGGPAKVAQPYTLDRKKVRSTRKSNPKSAGPGSRRSVTVGKVL